ncbi:cobaltochelatase subunit CobN [Microvirga antarctica]|uniref:cobaltochelatase subunit CobN n=1 Tax=Microvirga antarctica TaxID=2819233 RepID=UPI001B311D0E|nr:cobaltochelatase subunit CobN [Microvirga antarctica]
MHLLPVTSVSLDESDRAIDLDQAPGDVLALSFTDSDLSALAAAHTAGGADLPSLRLASLRQLKHPLSVDLYADKTAIHARFILVRCLGGLDYWRYGLERLRDLCREGGIPLAILPGDDRPDERLSAFSTVAPDLVDDLDSYFRAGGVENMQALLRRIGQVIGSPGPAEVPRTIPRAFAWSAEDGVHDVGSACRALPANRPVAYLIVYRSAILSADTLAIAALSEALAARGLAPLVLAVASLKDDDAVDLLRSALALRAPDIILTGTVFSAREGETFVLDAADCPILQVLSASSTRAAWLASERGLSGSDMTMQVVLPEFDGRIAIGPIAFKEETPPHPQLGFTGKRQVPDPDGIALAADQVLGWVRLRRTRPADRHLALILSDYPARGGRAGFAVGLDTPASVCRIFDCLAQEGYAVARDFDGEGLMHALTQGPPSFAVYLEDYQVWLAALPGSEREAIDAAWGAAESDPSVVDRAFRFRAHRAGNCLVALQPDRGRGADRKAVYHDPGSPPSHAYLAFYLGLRQDERIDALIHLGTHGTTEWLPGKAVALSGACAPRLAIGSLPVIYPFIVDDPGEAAPAKRRLAGITVGHMTPAVAGADLSDDMAVIRELVEEYASAQSLDPRRASLISREIMERAESAGLFANCAVEADTPLDEALTALDAHLCDLAEVVSRDGLHIFGEGAGEWAACGHGERDGLLRALDGRFVIPGPAGSPSRGRRDVMPTGRNLATLDPRAIPTRSAAALGARAAAEIIRRHLQDEGDYPRRVVMDLWASPTLRSGGEDMAHAMALMGVRPRWDTASTRVTGFEIVPAPLLDHPRIDVTLRISGVFRDTFPDQIVLLDRAARAVAALEEEDEWNALAAARRRGEPLSRIFGAAPGRFGAGVAGTALDEDWQTRDDLGRAYLAQTSHAFGQTDDGQADPSFAERVAAAEAFVHVTDVAERDLLDGDSTGDAVGGFAAASRLLGANPQLYSLDTSRTETPKARTLREDIARLVHGRLVNPRWIEANMRHGWRGAAELAQGVDALYVFAATTDAVTNAALDAVYNAYVGDEALNGRIQAANPAAADAIVARLADARQRGLWVSRRNSVDARLDALLGATP